jgi:NADH-quinone oxidoreductase subunit B
MGAELTTSRLEDAANWARKFSLFTYPFVTACCGMEYMQVAGPKWDVARFGAEFPRFSPRQSDLLFKEGRGHSQTLFEPGERTAAAAGK